MNEILKDMDRQIEAYKAERPLLFTNMQTAPSILALSNTNKDVRAGGAWMMLKIIVKNPYHAHANAFIEALDERLEVEDDPEVKWLLGDIKKSIIQEIEAASDDL